jgi:uncharacterized protein YndB with AHSA1/START domain
MPIASMSKISDASVKKGTGKDWKEWLSILNKSGGQVWTHQDIVAFLKKKYKLGPWWQQMVATSYEIAIGRREEGKNQKGFYSTVATRTFPVGKKKLWSLLNSPEGLAIWLRPVSEFKMKPGQTFDTSDEYFGEVRTVKAGERARLRWQEPEWERPSIVQLYAGGRTKDKSMLAITHDDLASVKLRNKMRDHWKSVLVKLVELSKNA